nr:transformation/transcription domain-associated protein isoform X2 [Tanacetum cinerariifolium]
MCGVIDLGALVGKVTVEKGWISWGNYCDMAFKETHDEIWLEYTMNCFLQGIKFGIPTSRSHLARVQYLISSDTPNEPVALFAAYVFRRPDIKKEDCLFSFTISAATSHYPPSQPPPPTTQPLPLTTKLPPATLLNRHKKAFKETHDEILLEYTMNCFLQGRAFDKFVDQIPHWVWLSWIPQLLLSLQRSEAQHCKLVLLKVATVHRQAGTH